MATAGSLLIDIDARTANFEKEMKKVDRRLRGIEGRTKKTSMAMGRMSSVMDRLGKFASVAAVAFAAFKLARITKEAIEFARSISLAADKIGFTTDELQELQFAGTQFGVNIRTLNMGLQRFSRRTAEAAAGHGELKDTLKQLNIQLRDSDGRMKSNVQLLGEYADAIKNADSVQEQLRLAFKAFDSEGAILVNILKQGGAGLDELRVKAQAMGLVLSEQMIRKADDAGVALEQMSAIIGTNFQRILLSVTPLIVSFGDAFVGAADSIRSFSEFFVSNELAGVELLEARLVEAREAIQRFKDVLDSPLGSLRAFFVPPAQDLEILEARVQNLRKLLLAAKALADKTGEGPAGTGRGGAASALEKVLQALRFEQEQLGRNSVEQRIFNTLKLAGIDINHASAGSLKDLVVAIERQKDSTTAAAKAEQTRSQIFDQTRTAAEKYGLEIERLERLEREHVISIELRNRAMEQAREEFERTKEKVDSLKDVFERFGDDSLDSLIRLAQGGKNAFKDMVQSILADIARLQLRKAATAIFGGGDFLGDFLGSIFGGGGLPPAGPFAKGDAFDQGRVARFARGGIVNKPTLFPMAHGAGLMGEAGPEAVMPLKRGAGGRLGVSSSGGSPTINIINNAGVEIGVEQSGDGEIDIVITQVTRSLINDIRRGGSDFANTMETTWGLGRGPSLA